MGIQVEVVSNSAKARADLEKLNSAVNKIKSAAANFRFNPFGGDSGRSLDTANKQLATIATNTKSAQNSLNQFGNSTEIAQRKTAALNKSLQDYNKQTVSAHKVQVKQSDAVNTTAKNLTVMNSAVDASIAGFKELALAITAALVGGTAFRAFVVASDNVSQMNNKLKLATTGVEEFNVALKDTKVISLSTFTSLSATADLYSKMASATTGFARSQKDVARVTQTVNRAVALSGSSVESATAAVMQLGQALSSGNFAGDELRSIGENAAFLMRTIADGLGTTVAGVREMGKQGQISSESLFNAILSQSEKVDAAAANMEVTFGKAFTNMRTSVNLLFQSLTAVTGSTGGGGMPKAINASALMLADLASRLDLVFLNMELSFWSFVSDVEAFFKKPINISFNIEKITPDKIFSNAGALFQTVKSFVVGRADGGYVSGPGSSTSDSIPARLSNGEFVVNARATARHRSALESINARGFANGGFVGPTTGIGQDMMSMLALMMQTTEKYWKELLAGVAALIAMYSVGLKKSLMLGATMVAGTYGVGKWLEFVDTKREKYPQIAPNVKLLDRLKVHFDSLTGRGPYIGGGPYAGKDRENRSRLHDAFQTFVPQKLQIPAIIAATLAAVGLTMSIFSPGGFRTFLLSALTTGSAILATDITSKKQRSDATASVVFKGLEGIKIAIESLIGKGPFGNNDFLGVLLLIAKSALLFQAGRDAWLATGKALIQFPSQLGGTVTKFGQRAIAARGFKQQQRSLERVEKVLSDSEKRRDNTAKDLARLVNPTTGQQIGGERAKALARGATEADIAERRAIQEDLRRQQRQMLDAQRRVAGPPSPQFRQQYSELEQRRQSIRIAMRADVDYTANKDQRKASIEQQQERTDIAKDRFSGLDKAIKEARAKTVEGIYSAASGVGGLFGGLAGYNLGVEMAKGLSSATPEWVKVGTAIGVAMLGQFLGSAFATLIVSLAAGMVALLGTALSLPVAAITAAVISIAAALSWDKVGPIVKKAWDVLATLGATWGKDFIDFITPKLSNILDAILPEAFKSDQYKKRTAAQRITGDATDARKEAEKQYKLAPEEEKAAMYEKLKLARATEYAAKMNEARVSEDHNYGFNSYYGAPRRQATIVENRNLAESELAGYKRGQDAENDKKFDALMAAIRAEKSTTIPADRPEQRPITPKDLEALRKTVLLDTERVKDPKNSSSQSYDNFSQIGDKLVLVGNIYKEVFGRMYDVAAAFTEKNYIKRATGGFISGPGSGTSDSIPAMLSNGEFVVNAKDSKKNAGLLSAINSGKTVRHFSKGSNSGVPAIKFTDEVEKALEAAAKQYGQDLQMLRRIVQIESAGKVGGPDSPVGARGIAQFMPLTGEQYGLVKYDDPDRKNPNRKIVEDNRHDPVKSADAMARFIRDLRKQYGDDTNKILSAYNFGSGNTNDAAKRGGGNLQYFNLPPETRDYIVKYWQLAADKAKEQAFRVSGGTTYSTRREKELPGYKGVHAGIANTEQGKVAHIGTGEKSVVGGIKEIMASVVSGIESAISMLPPEYQKMIKPLTDALKNLVKGPVQDPLGKTPAEVAKTIAEATGGAVVPTLEQIMALDRNQFDTLVPLLEALKVDTSKMSETQKILAENSKKGTLNTIKGILDVSNRPNVEGGNDLVKKLEGMQDDQVRAQALTNELTKANVGQGISLEEYQQMSEDELQRIAGYLLNIKNIDAKVLEITKKGGDPRRFVNLRSKAEQSLDQFVKNMKAEGGATGATKKKTYFAGAEEGGEKIAENFVSDLSGGLALALRGRASVKSVGKDLLDKLTQNIVNGMASTATQGFMDASGAKKLMSEMLRDLLDTVGTGASKAGDAVKGVFTDTESEAYAKIENSRFASRAYSMRMETAQSADLQESAAKAAAFGAENQKREYNSLIATATSATVEATTVSVNGPVFGRGQGFQDPRLNMVVPGQDFMGPPTEQQFQNGAQGFVQELDRSKGLDGELFGKDAGNMFSEAIKAAGGMSGFMGDGFGKALGGVNTAMNVASNGMKLFENGAKLFKFFGLADGGYISGPGTGRSDSIPAMLSNGEFVVNSKSTERFAPLLHAINSGRFTGFADGGYAGSTVLAAANQMARGGSNNSAVVNISITGDISRQTRREIMSMMPEITSGVNGVNRETGYTSRR